MTRGPTPSSPTVLVVEDEMVLRMRAVDIVEDAGFNPLEAVNADEALSILESRILDDIHRAHAQHHLVFDNKNDR